MVQATNWGVPRTGPATPTDYAARDDDSLDALLSSHSGPEEPPYKVRGTIWDDTTTNTLKRWNGTAWRIVDEDMAQATFVGRAAGAGTGARQVLTPVQGRTLLSVPALSDFANSLGTNGSQDLPGGLKEKWGYNAGGADSFQTFPVAFPTQCFFAFAFPTSASLPATTLLANSVESVSATGFTYRLRTALNGGAVGQSAAPFFWYAKGR